MKVDSIRVLAPTSVVFLCGGALTKDGPPSMLRDAFYRTTTTGRHAGYDVVLAEAAQPLTADAGYSDLLSFESDIAQVVGAILLFAESAGSLAELGAFAALKTVAPSLIAVLTTHYYSQSSFIRNGPIKFLETAYGDEWVHVLDEEDLGITADGSLAALDSAKLSSAIEPTIQTRLKKRSRWSSFDKSHDGHVILLIVGLCQELGALTLTEIREYLKHFDVNDPRLDNFLYCAILLGWIEKVRKGNHIFYVGVSVGNAIQYQVNTGIQFRDKIRWRADVRAYWAANDVPRLRAVNDVSVKRQPA